MLSSVALHAKQQLSASVVLDATADHPNFALEFLLFPESNPNDPTERVGIALGAPVVPLVKDGNAEYRLAIEVPADIAPGNYRLYVHEYPDGEFLEATEVYQVSTDPNLPLLEVRAFQADQQALLVDTDDTVDPQSPQTHREAPFTATVEVASHDHTATNVPLRAFVYGPDPTGVPIPLLIWDAKQNQYVSRLFVNSLGENTSRSVYLELAMSETDAQTIRARLQPQTPFGTRVLIVVNDDHSVPEADCPQTDAGLPTCAHQMETSATLFVAPTALASQPAIAARQYQMLAFAQAFPTNQKPLSYEKNFQKYSENGYVGAGVTFSAAATLSQAGFESHLKSTLPIKIFGNRFDFASATVDAQAPLTQDAQLTYSITMATPDGPKQLLGATLKDPSVRFTLADATDPSQPLTFQKEVSYYFTVWVYCVPVTVGLGARGTFGLNAAINLSSSLAAKNAASLDLSAGPQGNVSAFGFAGVGTSYGGWGFSAGIQVDLTLVNALLTAHAGGSLSVALDSQNVPLYLSGGLSERLDYRMNFLDGRIELVAYYPTIKWCKALGVPYPCGLKQDESALPICSWDGFALGPYVLLDKHQDAFQIALRDCMPRVDCTGKCGSVDDGCGTTLNCGGCTAPNTCGGSGVVNVCGSPGCPSPESDAAFCARLGKNCQTVTGTDNCAKSRSVNCGTCSGADICRDNVCEVCSPNSDCGGRCGTLDNGCGGTFDCGCDDGMSCVSNQCHPVCAPEVLFGTKMITISPTLCTGVKDDRRYPKESSSNPCGDGYVRGECLAWKDSGHASDNAHCEARWASEDDVNDCTCLVHFGSTACDSIHCDVRITRQVAGCVQ